MYELLVIILSHKITIYSFFFNHNNNPVLRQNYFDRSNFMFCLTDYNKAIAQRYFELHGIFFVSLLTTLSFIFFFDFKFVKLPSGWMVT